MMRTLAYAPDAFRNLNGIFCVYKPSGVISTHVRNTLAFNLCRDLNEMEQRKPRDFVRLKGSVISGDPLEVEVVPNYADHELVSGPHYQVQDIRMKWVYHLGKQTSGVFLMAVNDGCKMLRDIAGHNHLRTYEIKGRLGLATDNFMEDGKVVHRATYSHVRQAALERILTTIQASHQALAYKYAGVDVHSQAGYELASKGVVRPSGKSNTLIYGIKCLQFERPNFTLEVHCINETEAYFAELIHEIGVYLKSVAICTGLRQTQFGHFMLDHALLRKHWTLENILNNIALCKEVLSRETLMPTSAHFKSVKVSKLKEIVEDMQNEAREDVL